MTTVNPGMARRATVRLGVLAAVLLVAGALPWLTGGETAVRLLALPFLVVGLVVATVAVRVRAVLRRAAAHAAANPAPLVERGCDGCACGGGGCGTAAALSADAAVSSDAAERSAR